MPVSPKFVFSRHPVPISWLALACCTGLMASIFVSAATAAAVASAVAAPAVCLLLWRAWTYERLLLATLVATSNLFILHRAIALHSSTGDNIFGIRDVFLIAFEMMREKSWTTLLTPLAVLVPAITLLNYYDERAFLRRWAPQVLNQPEARKRRRWLTAPQTAVEELV